MSSEFLTAYQTYAAASEKALEEQAIGFQTDSVVAEAMKYSLLGGGKRVRAVLTLACCEALTGDHGPALPAACGIEMVHAYSLIHDDLPCMDNDDFRRGKPSCHKRFGEAVALLAGDALQTEAFGCISKIADPAAAQRCCRILAAAAGGAGMVYGQELDLEGSAEPKDEASLLKIHGYKTGKMIRAACAMGAVIGGANETQIELLDEYAAGIGLAFQIIDDILDVTADETVLGKPVGSDAENEKYTFVSLLGIDGSRRRAAEVTEKAKAAASKALPGKSRFLEDLADWLVRRES